MVKKFILKNKTFTQPPFLTRQLLDVEWICQRYLHRPIKLILTYCHREKNNNQRQRCKCLFFYIWNKCFKTVQLFNYFQNAMDQLPCSLHSGISINSDVWSSRPEIVMRWCVCFFMDYKHYVFIRNNPI